MTIRTPLFYSYYARTYRIDTTADGGLIGHILNLDTGEFDEDNTRLREVLHAGGTSDIDSIGEAEFVQETEAARGDNLSGGGPIFALYDTIRALGRSPQELALVHSLRTRTYGLWEAELARRASGQPPSFSVASRTAER
ncbi:hypothetical protein ACIQUM_00985 [Amycolatopsis azurea]|uniref:hypothetical protein n=1 Tax=Amycolatopsis azurea TaxID=36819 RepID=UPI003812D1B8